MKTSRMKFLRTAALAVVGLVLAGYAEAQTLLRWKLEPGQQLVVDCQQHTTTVVAFSGKSAESTVDLGMELLWTVTAADDKGFAIKQSIRRFQFKLDSTKSGVMQYDSAAKTRPTGQAREVADAVAPLLGAEVEITMTPRGEIVAAKPGNAAAEKLFAGDAAVDKPGVFSPKTIETLLRHPLAILPAEPIADDASWTSTGELESAPGRFKQITTYHLAGTKEQAGQTLTRIDVSAALEPLPGKAANKAASKLTIKQHEQTGHFLFSAELGRLVSAEQNQKLTTERPYRETTIVVSLTSKQTTTMRLADEKAALAGEP
jgi:hypothetical protein